MASRRTGEAVQVPEGLLPVRRPADVDYRLADDEADALGLYGAA